MKECLVMTIIGPDRPGLVSKLAKTVAENNGNWLESRLARLSGQFAGAVRVECNAAQTDTIVSALKAEAPDGFRIEIAREENPPNSKSESIHIELLANDRPGIVSELSEAILRAGGNIEELESCIENAAHAGHPLFKAEGRIAMTTGSENLISALEELSPDLQVSII